jgi:RNA polymerase primary sigma factor
MKITNENIQESLTSIGKTFKILSDRERKILRLRHGLEDGEPKTLKQVATIEKVTRERIRQIESRAIEKIDLVLKYEE